MTQDTGEYLGVETTELLRRKEHAAIGYYKMNIASPPSYASWGVFNDRQEEQKSTNILVASYRVHLDNCTSKTAIDVLIRKKWLKDEKKEQIRVVDGKKLSDLPELEFKAEFQEEINRETVHILGGNHRKSALEKYIKEREADLAAIRKKLAAAKVEDIALDEGNPSATDNLAALKDDEAKTVRDLEKATRWAIRVYDRGE